jgi:DNA-binding response OmpR family regulator
MKKRILFVDDESNIRLTLPAILRNEGFDVSVASSVLEAIDAIQHFQFDILLSDLNIGEPGDGFTVVSAMRRILGRINALTPILGAGGREIKKRGVAAIRWRGLTRSGSRLRSLTLRRNRCQP